MTTGTESALAMMADMAGDLVLEDAIGSASQNAAAVDEASQKIGLRTVEYVGLPTQYRPGGVGDAADALAYASRLVNVHPVSRGAGLVGPIPGHGAEDARESLTRLGRVARGEIDSYESFLLNRDTTTIFSFGTGDYRAIDGFTINIAVADRTTAFLKATAFIDAKPVASSAGIDIVICLGNEGVRIGSDVVQMSQNVLGSDSRSLPIGFNDIWNQATHTHGRLIIGTPDTESLGVACSVKVKQLGTGASGGGGTQSKFKAGDTFVITADGVNMRATASTSGTVIIQRNTGNTGTINSGPVSGSGYIWYYVTSGANSGYIVQDYMRKTNQDAPVATTNSIRGGFLEIERIPA